LSLWPVANRKYVPVLISILYSRSQSVVLFSHSAFAAKSTN